MCVGGGGGGCSCNDLVFFFQHPRLPSFVRTADQMTSEMGVGHSGSALKWCMVCSGECRCAPGRFPAGRRLDR